MKKVLFIYFIGVCQLIATEYRSKIPYAIPTPKELIYGTIVFSNGRETVAFKSEQAQNVLLYGKIPEKELLQSFEVDLTNLKDMKWVPFEEIPPGRTEGKFRDYNYYATSKEYVSRIYFLNASSQKREYFVYYEVINKDHNITR